MTAAAQRVRGAVYGQPRPRIAPPRPARHDLEAYRLECAAMGIEPMPWQTTAAEYLTAKGKDDSLVYREVAIVVARQNGKTTLTKPLVLARLKAGRHVMHIAQVRELPRTLFESLADTIEEHYPHLLPTRRGKVIWARRASGSESILLKNGASYRIAAANRDSARGFATDDLIIDELREMESWDVINAAKPAQRFSLSPQTIYLSNAGTDRSVVLNSLKRRAGHDPDLAYLEWSADPERPSDDLEGWREANPAIGHFPQVLEDLQKDYRAAVLGGNLAGFETESLCRWVPTTRAPLIDQDLWIACADTHPDSVPRLPVMAVSIDPDRRRASAAIAWARDDGIALRLAFDVTVDVEGTAALGTDLRTMALKLGVKRVGYDPLTDGELAKYFKKPEPISGQKFANASSQFAGLVAAGQVRWAEADGVTDDLTWTSRKVDAQSQTFEAVRARDDRPITAALAAIRAVWLASGVRPIAPRVM